MVVVMVGLPGSGKSSYAKRLQSKEPETIIISSEKTREEVTGSRLDFTKEDRVFLRFHNKIKKLHKENPDGLIVADATNLSEFARNQYRKYLKESDIQFVQMKTPFEICCQRRPYITRDQMLNYLYRYEPVKYWEKINSKFITEKGV